MFVIYTTDEGMRQLATYRTFADYDDAFDYACDNYLNFEIVKK